MPRSDSPLYIFGPYRLDPAERVLLRAGQPVALPPKAFDMLAVLVRNSGHVVEKEELLRAVWPETFVEEGNLSQHVFHLRRVLSDGSGDVSYIETVPKRGYRFTAPVSESGSEEHGRRTRILSGAVIFLGLVAAFLLWMRSRPGEPAQWHSIAVLPFVNLSPEPENEYFSDGLTEELITALSKIEGLKVAARTSVFRFKGKAQDIRAIGRDLGVGILLEGSVRKERETLRVTAQLIRVADGYHLWSESYDRGVKDVFAIQDDICSEIVNALRISLPAQPGQRLVKRYSEDLEAYTLYWKGRYQWNQRSLNGVRKGMEFFQQVIEKDSGYALAYAGLADCYNLLGGYNVVPPSEAFPRAREVALKAIEIDDTLAEAHASLGSVKGQYEWDWQGAEKEYRRAIQLKPSYATAHQWYAEYLATLGRHQEARNEIRQALELEPLSPTINYVDAFLLFLARDYDASIRQSLKAQEIDPAFPVTPFVLGYAYEQKGMYAEAETEFRKGMELTGGFGVRYLGHVLALSGRSGEALRVLGELQQRARTDYVSPYDYALIFIALGDRNRAFAWLDKAVEERTNWLTHLKVDPRFDPLRQDQRFAQLVKKVGLP